MNDLYIVLVYSKPRGSVICESATALGLCLTIYFACLSFHSYLVDLDKLKSYELLAIIIIIKRKKKRTSLQICGGCVCFFNFRDTVRMRIKDQAKGSVIMK